ncbi:putative clathrin assembly protein At1g25240 [Aristolochia californica]|uniref:putative clathrin assembly protein At1g25240 n=1 Tax=Aristolochia californica TaxID=171875 RepID=UPI0035DF2718
MSLFNYVQAHERPIARAKERRKEGLRMATSLWKRAAAALKDTRSLCMVRMASRKGFRNADLEAAIIKATSHDEFSIDYKNAHRVFLWIRTSPTFLKPLIWCLTRRMEKTHCWVVALKGLMLTHGVFCVKIPALKKIGRLPFDLSKFEDRTSGSGNAWALSAFVRAYFTFLDQSSTFLSFSDDIDKESMQGALIQLQRSQALLNLLLQIRPCQNGLRFGLILEAMDCVVIEIFDVYSIICKGLATVLPKIFMVKISEATMALEILQRAALQCTQLQSFFDVCKRMGVLNAAEFPPVEKIPEEDIRELERIICGVSGNGHSIEDNFGNRESASAEKETDWRNSSGTVISHDWVIFHDEFQVDDRRKENRGNPFVDHSRDGFRDWEEFTQWQQEQKLVMLQCGSAMEERQRNLIRRF